MSARRPKARFPRRASSGLPAMGKWMKVNGESIYGTDRQSVRDAAVVRPGDEQAGRVYLHVFDWPADGKLTLPSWGGTPAKAWLVATKADVPVKTSADGVTLTLPSTAPESDCDGDCD